MFIGEPGIFQESHLAIMTQIFYSSKIAISIREFFSSFTRCMLATIHTYLQKSYAQNPRQRNIQHLQSPILTPQKVDDWSSRSDGWFFPFPLLKGWGILSMFAWNPVIRPLCWFGKLNDSFEGTETSTPQNISDISGLHFQVHIASLRTCSKHRTYAFKLPRKQRKTQVFKPKPFFSR